MKFPVLSNQVINEEKIDKALMLINETLLDLRDEGYPELALEDFIKYHIYPNSIEIRKLQARCFYKGILNLIIDKSFVDYMLNFFPNFELYHASFIRYHHPKMTSNGYEKLDNILATPLHYDNYGQETITTGIPLTDINTDT